MKESYRPYSGVVIALKAALLPAALGLIDACFDGTKLSENVATNLTMASKALSVALLEVIFLAAVKVINDKEVISRRRVVKGEINALQELLPNASTQEKAKINSKLKSLKSEQIDLTSK